MYCGSCGLLGKKPSSGIHSLTTSTIQCPHIAHSTGYAGDGGIHRLNVVGNVVPTLQPLDIKSVYFTTESTVGPGSNLLSNWMPM
jgi:hypothetical protein